MGLALEQKIHHLIRTRAGGNSRVMPKHIASDHINALSDDDIRAMAEETELCVQTIKRLGAEPDNYWPSSHTVDQVLQYCDQEAHYKTVKINKRYKKIEKY